MIVNLVNDSSALNAFTSAANELATVKIVNGNLDGVHSIITQLPGGPAIWFNSVLNAESSIASSIVNKDAVVTGAAASSTAAPSTFRTLS
jgi:hypothetical protein